MSHQEALLLLLASLMIVANAQRPLNTTNTINFLLEPFFVKPTSTSSRNAIPEMRSAGSKADRSAYPSDFSHGFSKENPNGQVQPHLQNANINKLHKVDRERQRKMDQLSLNSSSKKGSFNALKIIVNNPSHEFNQRSDNFSVGVVRKNEPLTPGSFRDPQDQNHSANNVDSIVVQPRPAFNVLKDQLNNKTFLHTPVTPAYDQDYDFDEKLGVKCTFEKPCSWTFENVEGSNFEVTTGVNLTLANITGLS